MLADDDAWPRGRVDWREVLKSGFGAPKWATKARWRSGVRPLGRGSSSFGHGRELDTKDGSRA